MVPCALAAVWLAALPGPEASASEVVDVRLALHPSYSRVVIELDRASGYRLERDTVQGVLTVTVEASARPETLTLLSGAVASVEVEPGRDGARASIRLRDKQARVAESLFSDPPRIVLDFHSDVPSEAHVAEAASPAPPIAATPEPAMPAVPEPESALEESVPVEESLPEAEPVPPVAEATPEPSTPAAPEAEGTMEEPPLEVDPLPPAEALPMPAQSERGALPETGPALVLYLAAGVALGILVLWRRWRARRARPSLARSVDFRESAAPPKTAERARERPTLQTPPSGLRDTGDAPAGPESAAERVRRLEEREGKAPQPDAPKGRTTMTGMTRQR